MVQAGVVGSAGKWNSLSSHFRFWIYALLCILDTPSLNKIGLKLDKVSVLGGLSCCWVGWRVKEPPYWLQILDFSFNLHSCLPNQVLSKSDQHLQSKHFGLLQSAWAGGLVGWWVGGLVGWGASGLAGLSNLGFKLSSPLSTSLPNFIKIEPNFWILSWTKSTTIATRHILQWSIWKNCIYLL